MCMFHIPHPWGQQSAICPEVLVLYVTLPAVRAMKTIERDYNGDLEMPVIIQVHYDGVREIAGMNIE